MSDSEHLLWVDIETTGLDVETDDMLEIAVIATTPDLDEVLHYTTPIQPSYRALLEMDDDVHDMHERSGLLQTLDRGVLPATVAYGISTYLYEKGISGKSPMCGSSVHFDRSFIARDMPELHSLKFTHRNIDVSSIKELVRRWYGEDAVYDPNMHVPPSARETRVRHRALDDIRTSIDELKYYRRSHFFRGGKP